MDSGWDNLVPGLQQTMHYMHESTAAEDSRRGTTHLLHAGWDANFSAERSLDLHVEANFEGLHAPTVVQPGSYPYGVPDVVGNGTKWYATNNHAIDASQYGTGAVDQQDTPSWTMTLSPNATLHSTPSAHNPTIFNNYCVAAATDYGLNPYGFPTDTGTVYATHVPVAARFGYPNNVGLQHWPPVPPTNPFLNPTPFAPTFTSTPPFPAPVATPANTGATTQSPPTCPNCGNTFTRTSDLDRHMKKYQPGPKEYQCAVAGCKYKGSHRKDKLEDHVRRRHPESIE